MRKDPQEAPKAGEVSLDFDTVNEAVVVAAAAASAEARAGLTSRIPADAFLEPRHAAIWSSLQELERRHLAFDLATLPTLVAGVDAGYLANLIELRPTVPENLQHHVETLFWDRARVNAWGGPISALIQAVRDPRTDRARVRALAQQLSTAFDGFGDRRHLLDPARLVRDQIEEIRQRRAGYAVYPYGLPALDDLRDAKTGYPLILPGAAPGEMTLVTGISGSGKTTMVGHLILGLARQKKRVVVGAWEVTGGITLELVACLALGWSRTQVLMGDLSDDAIETLREKMEAISRWVRFLENPFTGDSDQNDRRPNDRNVDLVGQYIADTGADVIFCDLWERCLEDDDSAEEKRAIYRMQRILQRSRCHGIFTHLNGLGDIEKRNDKRPTREGVKGSKAYIEAPDTIFGTHRPALFKAVPDNTFEIDVLKQRFGRWPLAIECDWVGDTGMIANGREVPYESAEPSGGSMQDFLSTPSKSKKGRDR